MADPQVNSTRSWKFSEYAATNEPIPDAVIPITSLATGSVRLGGIGDSITAQNNNADPLKLRAGGFLTWACVYSRDRLITDADIIFGFPGQTSGYILSQLPNAIKMWKTKKVKFVTVLAGTNDLADSSISAADTANNIRSICAQILAAEIVPIVIPITPRKYGTPQVPIITKPLQDKLQRANMLIRNHTRFTPGIRLVDPTAAVTDHSNNNGYPIGTAGALGYTADDLHPATRMAQTMGKLIFKNLEPDLSVSPTSMVTGANVWSVDNPTGNHFVNGMLNGIAGTKPNGVTGDVADNWDASKTAGVNVAATKTTLLVDDVLLPAQQFVVTAGASPTATENLILSQTAGNIAIGERVYVKCEVEVTGIGADSLKGVILSVRDGAAGNLASCLTQDQYLLNESWRGVLRTPVLTAQVANVGLTRVEIPIDGTKAGAGVTIKIAKIELITIES